MMMMMMRRGWLALLALGGCDQAFGIGVVGPLAADAPRAVDGVAVVDAVPGPCWGAERVHDDDHDGVPDGCDWCPGNANADPTDTDGDGIPDTCDPRSGHDVILGFLPFDTLTGWQGMGVWTSDGNDLMTPGGTALLERQGVMVPSNAFIQLRVTEPDASASLALVGIYFDVTNASALDLGVSCDVERTNATEDVVGQSWANSTPTRGQTQLLGGGGDVWIYARLHDGACLADRGTAASRVTIGAPGGIDRTAQLAVRTESSGGTFKSILIIVPAP